jgi:tRNA G18 (ribose-2'-O)-methylase SpoU
VGPVVAIHDPADTRVDDYRNLTDAQLRQREEPAAGLFMVEGGAVIRQLLVSDYPVRSLLLTDNRLAELSPVLRATAGDWPVFVAGNDVLRAITGFPFHRGALAAANRQVARPWRAVVRGSLIAVAEGIGDHENMGALFRNAAAFGVGAILLSPSSVDPLYRRAIRVSMGHVLRVPWARIDPWPEGLEDLRAVGYRIVALTPDPAALPLEARPATATAPVAVLLGAEGPGLTAGARARADDVVRIPMAAGVDSVNVATAAAIAFHILAGLARPAL